MGKSRTAADLVLAAERRTMVLRLRKAGYSYTEIMDQVKISRGQVSKILTRALDDYAAKAAADVEEIRNLENSRLDQAIKGIYPQVVKGHLGAIDRMVRIMERRARLLGLDAPSKIAPTDPTGANEYSGGGLASLLEQPASDKNDGGS